MTKIIGYTENGSIFICSKCKLIHFEFKNLGFNFNQKEFEHFAKYIQRLEGDYWEIKNANNYFKRKIAIPIGQSNFNVLLNNNELLELKDLFSGAIKKQQDPTGLFDYTFNNN
ncbi:hypothetical protein HZY62_07955 [Maribacter polysiphoniae]|uniref:Uncharacterized protein n=1 Tax=Maribacter polysiphoniae TaxID=429344 RepID=A0A316E152_9FLAO|nr:DUF6686 family protein [Maribacter polysiphoniae]MBD1260519.1 hypothetical protein [Maribacter polysiphoniae]PWK24357.1 hypothetical protein LX92_01947 [Maribacter polysiphoniae]